MTTVETKSAPAGQGKPVKKQGERDMKPASINLATVLIALRNGFGVEDIAVGTGQPVKRIRGMVETLRKRGILANVREWKGAA